MVAGQRHLRHDGHAETVRHHFGHRVETSAAVLDPRGETRLAAGEHDRGDGGRAVARGDPVGVAHGGQTTPPDLVPQSGGRDEHQRIIAEEFGGQTDRQIPGTERIRVGDRQIHLLAPDRRHRLHRHQLHHSDPQAGVLPHQFGGGRERESCLRGPEGRQGEYAGHLLRGGGHRTLGFFQRRHDP